MDRHGLELQLRLIRLTYRREAAGFSGEALAAYRRRAGRILDDLVDLAGADDQLLIEIEGVRREIGA